MGWNCPGCTMEIPLCEAKAIRRHEASCEGLAEMRAAEQQREAARTEAIRAAVAEERERWKKMILDANEQAETLDEKGQTLMSLARTAEMIVE